MCTCLICNWLIMNIAPHRCELDAMGLGLMKQCFLVFDLCRPICDQSLCCLIIHSWNDSSNIQKLFTSHWVGQTLMICLLISQKQKRWSFTGPLASTMSLSLVHSTQGQIEHVSSFTLLHLHFHEDFSGHSHNQVAISKATKRLCLS